MADGVVTGYGIINGRLSTLFSRFHSIWRYCRNAEKICKVMDMAMKNGAPVIGLNDSEARIQGVSCARWLCRIFTEIQEPLELYPKFQPLWGLVLVVLFIHQP